MRTILYCALVAPLIVATAAASDDGRHADAVTVYHCAFGDEADVDFDGWPDHWTRQSGLDYPHYVDIAIHEDTTAAHNRCLRFDLDGGAAAVSSPPIRVLPRYSYVLEAQVKGERIVHSRVVLRLDFHDARGRVLQTGQTKPVKTTRGWELLQLGPVEPSDAAIDRVTISLLVERSGRGDLEGRVSLADVRLVRFPRIAVSTTNPSNVYTELEGIVVQCELSGIPVRQPEVRFQLLDAAHNELQSHRVRLDGRRIADEAERTAGAAPGDSGPDPPKAAANQPPVGYEATTEWQPSIPDYGYYTVVVRMLSSDSAEDSDAALRELASRTIYLAVVPPLTMPRRGEFGWTLPEGDNPLSFQDLSRLLPQVGVNWIKLPVWFDGNDPRRGDELIRFVEFMAASNVEVVGIIDQAPAAAEELSTRLGRKPSIAELLSLDSATWAPSLEPVMARLALRVRWWQLGRDYDTSFVGLPALHRRFDELRSTLFRFGQDVRMGLCWDPASNGAAAGDVPWDFQLLCLGSERTEEAFEAVLAEPRQNKALHWILIEPPAADDATEASSESALLARCSKFVRQLVSAKVHGVDAIIVAEPFSDENGLMRASGMPGELLLPWRTTAVMLGDAEHLGQLKLPSGSENHVFRRPDGQVVMVAWNHEPTEEVLYLGPEVRQYDLFGRSTKAPQEGHEQVISLGPTPSFVIGLHEAITRWRLAVSLDSHQVPSVFAKPHQNSLHFHNFFPQGVGGLLRIVVLQDRHPDEPPGEAGAGEISGFTPDRWVIDPPQGTFQLAAGRDLRFPFEIRLKNALYGKQPVRIDYRIEADDVYEFSVYRDMEIGTDDLTLEVLTTLDEDGTLIVEQLMTNRTDRLADFKCYLYAKGHRRQRMHVYRLGASIDRKVYRFPEGADLVGQELLLEIEELNGPRMLRYRFVATAPPEESANAADSPEAAPTPPPEAEGHVVRRQS